MTIVNFTTPSDEEIIDSIDISKKDIIKFIGSGSVYQNLQETVYVRLIALKKNSIKKVIYKKRGMIWGFESIEEATI
ncbi:hypothetical protein R3X25_04415 [Lutibacter sp. TH_r2]|uniref:hypothetical protein n=1 Tax=Lutibacter sp. TH_r2 TaxID=3082083 RepID=UPI0029555420|nr:hypothetical protein [Lutibacter sp. TH_r2]MDV7186515.1 hypothetical protein [Lutibacter sp. TH_r2]